MTVLLCRLYYGVCYWFMYVIPTLMIVEKLQNYDVHINGGKGEMYFNCLKKIYIYT